MRFHTYTACVFWLLMIPMTVIYGFILASLGMPQSDSVWQRIPVRLFTLSTLLFATGGLIWALISTTHNDVLLSSLWLLMLCAYVLGFSPDLKFKALTLHEKQQAWHIAVSRVVLCLQNYFVMTEEEVWAHLGDCIMRESVGDADIDRWKQLTGLNDLEALITLSRMPELESILSGVASPDTVELLRDMAHIRSPAIFDGLAFFGKSFEQQKQ